MAQTYHFIEASDDVSFVGTTVTEEIMRVTAVAQPSGVAFVISIPKSAYNPQFVTTAVSRQAEVLNNAAAHRNVVGLSTLQDVGVNNQYIDLAIITLQSNSGRSVNDYRAPYAVLEGGNFDQWVADRVATLDAVENA